MKSVCETCEIPCYLDSGTKMWTYPVVCPWPNVSKESDWVPIKYALQPLNPHGQAEECGHEDRSWFEKGQPCPKCGP
ncbi:MAG TPA: hypothetical protein ENH85_00350 [Candidatus Scalindua sp.]|nr:hypothetical protein [Candidatus Scalindua sp.]